MPGVDITVKESQEPIVQKCHPRSLKRSSVGIVGRDEKVSQLYVRGTENSG